MSKVNLGIMFKETDDCMNENNEIIELAVKKLGKILDKKNPSKSSLGEIYKALNQALKLRKRIKKVQDKLVEDMIEESGNT